MNRTILPAICLLVFLPLALYSEVAINEINYDPVDIGDEGGGLREFIELYNPGPSVADLSGYAFSNGVSFTFSAGVSMPPNSYLVVARDPSRRTWRNRPFPIAGPYEGSLSNGGERLTLSKPDGAIADSFKYNDNLPWPRGADGYGRSLERISWELPPDDFHSWRTSLVDEGTPGAKNSVDGEPPRPVILAWDVWPKHPSSSDPVHISAGIDSPYSVIAAWLRFEASNNARVTTETSSVLAKPSDEWAYWKGRSAPSNGLAWASPGFDDSSWERAKGGFGYGDLDHVATVLNDMRNNYSTFHIRKTFTVREDQLDGVIKLNMIHDDGFICYINGKEAARALAPATYRHDAVAAGNHESDVLEEYVIGSGRAFLQAGENTIALVGFNVTLGGSSDFVMAPELVLLNETQQNQNRIPMEFASLGIDSATLEATINPLPSQTLVRYNIELEMDDGTALLLPHQGEARPFESYFVYDGEIESKIPVMWIFDSKRTSLPKTPGDYNAAVVAYPQTREPLVFDGVRYIRSENGNKIKFLKKEEFRDDRTINLIPESPPFGGTAGSTGPFREFLGFWFYRQMGILAPRADWFRVIENPGAAQESMTQRLIVQQINERFLDMNGRDSNGDLFKLEWNIGFVKHTNKDEPTNSVGDLQRLLTVRNEAALKKNIEDNLDVEEFLTYSVANVLTSNWDGFFNNNWMFQNPPDAGGKWEVIPWDLDKLWGFTDSKFMFVEMSPEFPLDGEAQHASRRPGPITGPFHKVDDYHQEYKRRLRVELDNQFADDAPIHSYIDDWERVLLDDLDMAEAYLKRTQIRRRDQIAESFDVLREFIQLRKAFLDGVLPTPVEDWQLH